MKFPDPRFKRYRFVLRRESDKLKDGEELWGKAICLYEPTEYGVEELLPVGKVKLRLFWEFCKNDRRLEIWGQLVKDDGWVPVSPWLISQQRANELRHGAARQAAANECEDFDLRKIAGRVREIRAKHDGRDRVTKQEIAYCARRELGLSSEESLELLRLTGERVRRDQLSWLVRNGKKRADKDGKCRLAEEIRKDHEKS